VEGRRVIYFVMFRKYITSIIIPETTAIIGRRITPFSGCVRTNQSKIELSAQATQNML
jgi:hypothetical protein